jgi:hypothetical protein
MSTSACSEVVPDRLNLCSAASQWAVRQLDQRPPGSRSRDTTDGCLRCALRTSSSAPSYTLPPCLLMSWTWSQQGMIIITIPQNYYFTPSAIFRRKLAEVNHQLLQTPIFFLYIYIFWNKWKGTFFETNEREQTPIPFAPRLLLNISSLGDYLSLTPTS